MRLEHVRDYKQKVYRDEIRTCEGLQAESVQMRLECEGLQAESVEMRSVRDYKQKVYR